MSGIDYDDGIDDTYEDDMDELVDAEELDTVEIKPIKKKANKAKPSKSQTKSANIKSSTSTAQLPLTNLLHDDDDDALAEKEFKPRERNAVGEDEFTNALKNLVEAEGPEGQVP